jgi:PAS domain S-box-containing protein
MGADGTPVGSGWPGVEGDGDALASGGEDGAASGGDGTPVGLPDWRGDGTAVGAPGGRGHTEDVAAAAREREVSEALKERAMDEAPVGITISDPSLPDNPLIYVNEAYVRITGYPRAEAVGRNCRFLQGPATREEPVAEMRRAVDAGEPVSVELRNYRKSGELFWNSVTVAPIYEDGEVAYFVGFQRDVTRRKRAERAVREERAALESVLDRVEGLLAAVTAAVVQATGREELQERVTRRVVTTGPFDLAWFGEYGPDGVRPTTGVDAAGDDVDVAALDLSFDDDDPVARAVATDTLQVVADAAGRPDGRLHGPAWPDRFGSMAAIPLSCRDVTYGVLAVYGTEPRSFDEHDRVVLTSLGRTIGTALNALESQRRVAADEVALLRVDVTDTDWFPVKVARRAGGPVRLVGVEQDGDGRPTLLVDVSGADADAVADAADAPAVADVTTVAATDDGCVLAVTVSSSSLVATLAARGVRVQSFAAEPGEATLTLRLSAPQDGRTIFDTVAAHHPGASFDAIRRESPAVTTPRELAASVEDRLTDRQATALRRAAAAGFFDADRSVSGETIAESMSLAPSTFHQHLQAALSKVVDAVLDAPGDS